MLLPRGLGNFSEKKNSNTTTVARTLLFRVFALFGAEKNEIMTYLNRELNFLEEY
jgi:hypothetical protein